jgi:RNA polymerase sigma-70 factor, ECF subfamily
MGGRNAFLERFLVVQQSLYAFVRSFGFTPMDADDLVQDIAKALWESYESYDPARPFVGWSLGVARNLVRNRFRHQHVRRNMVVDSEACERIADHVSAVLEDRHSTFDEQKEALAHCLQELPSSSGQLICWRYYDRLSLEDIAIRIKKTYTATNTTMTRIRSALMECIKTRMAEAAL